MGLNESYNQCLSQIMMMHSPPSVIKAYSFVMFEEGQRILGKTNSIIRGHGGHMTDELALLSVNKDAM